MNEPSGIAKAYEAVRSVLMGSKRRGKGQEFEPEPVGVSPRQALLVEPVAHYPRQPGLLINLGNSFALKVKLGSSPATQTHVTAAFVDESQYETVDGRAAVATNSTSEVEVVAAPASKYTRKVKAVTICNRHSAAVAVSLFVDDGSTEIYILDGYSLAANQTLVITEHGITGISSSGSAVIPVDIQTFTGNGTWTKPSGGQTVARIFMTGGGGGGGSGRKGAAGSDRGGGGGGSGAGCVIAQVSISLLSATETVTIGAGGVGGAAVSASDTDGNNGVDGGASTFGSKFRATGGLKGAGGTTSGGAGGQPDSTSDQTTTVLPLAVDSFTNTGDAGDGSTGGALSSTNYGANNPCGPAAGGGGGGISAADATGSGGPGGAGSNGLAGAAGGASTVAGTAASGLAGTGCNGGGGGGSRAAGGAGIYGSGGGGGGAGVNAVANSGAGGAGGTGICVVICS